MLTAIYCLASILPVFVEQHLGWFLAAIIVIPTVIFGAADLKRFDLKRILAIGGVSMNESIRRRVLWVTPLAILGVIIVSQLQRPLDEQDAIRQTIKFCLFATGLLVAMTTVILACTNLPREIENRVIYTIVTKPTTRLEIVLGKVVGFAGISLLILAIMGAFTWGYLTVRAWSMQRYIAERLDSGQLSESSRGTLEHYRDVGLLSAKKLHTPGDLQIYARIPEAASGGERRWFAGNGEGSVVIPFRLSAEQLTPQGVADAGPGSTPVVVMARIGYQRRDAKKKNAPAAANSPATQASATQPAATTVPYYGPFIMSPEERQKIMEGTRPAGPPVVSIDVLDRNRNYLGNAVNPITNRPLELGPVDGMWEVRAAIAPNVAGLMANQLVFVRISGVSKEIDYFTEGDIVRLVIPSAGQAMAVAQPSGPPNFEGRQGTAGEQIRGGPDGHVGIYAFNDAQLDSGGETATFEMRTTIERSGAEAHESAEADQTTKVAIEVVNLQTKTSGKEVIVRPESNRYTYFSVPAAEINGGNFELRVRCLTPGHYLGVKNDSIALIASQQPFAFNLAKSLLILWLMAILITAIAIFCSTFLSWPIAIVLTVLILLAHWGVDQLGDAAAPGIGNQIVTDLGLTGSAKARAVSMSVEKLSGLLNVISAVLPDINQFSAVEDIERGVTISLPKVGSAAGVAFGFGIPLVLMAYVVLRNKEVAP